jgi:hypothetical protein
MTVACDNIITAANLSYYHTAGGKQYAAASATELLPSGGKLA